MLPLGITVSVKPGSTIFQREIIVFPRLILVPRDRRFLVTRGSTGRLQIKPSGSGDENVLRLFLLRMN